MDETDRGNPRLGWTIVLTIGDLAQLVEAPLPEKSILLREVWSDNWEQLGDSQVTVDAVLAMVDVMRDETLVQLHALE